MQVRGIGGGLVSGPTSSLCVIQSPVIGGGKETGATKAMTESRSEEEGVGSGHWCWQWLPAHVFFTGRQVQRSAWRWSSPWSKNAPNTTCGPPLLKDSLLSALKPIICMILQHYCFFTAEGGTVVSTRPLIRYGIPCIGKQCSTCSRETRPTRQRKTDTVQATGG